MQSFLPKCSYRRTKDVFTIHAVSVYTLTNMTNSKVTPIAPFVHGARTCRQLKCCCELLLWVTRGLVTFAERLHERHLNIAVHVAKYKAFIITDVANRTSYALGTPTTTCFGCQRKIIPPRNRVRCVKCHQFLHLTCTPAHERTCSGTHLASPGTSWTSE